MIKFRKIPYRFSALILIALLVLGVIFANKVQSASAAPSCSSPTTITGGGSFSVTTSGTCFKYVNTSFVNGGMFSVMKDATSTTDTLQWYGGMDQNSTSCANQSATVSGNGGQLNNFTIAKDSTGAMYLSITGGAANSVTISIQNWQNGSGCSVKPTVVGTSGATTAPTNTTAPTIAPTNTTAATLPPTATRTNTSVPTLGPTSTTAPTKTNTSIPTSGPTATKTNTPLLTPTKPPATNTPTFIPPTATSGTVTSGLNISIDKGSGIDNSQETTFNFMVKNTSTSAISNITVRVYFVPDGSNAASGYVMEKYYDQSGVATISGPTLDSGTNYYYTVSYGTATLAANGQWEFQTALHLSSWGSTFNGGNDWYHTGYAVGALPAAYTVTNDIPGYVSGVLSWGSTPSGGSAPTPTPAPPTKTSTPLPPTITPGGPTVTPAPVGTFVPLFPQTPLNVSNGNPVTGNATWFSALGMPYGGCGITQTALDTQDFLALNVQNTPGDYSTMLARPITAANASKIGMWDNGYNCGRWVKVTISDFCTGTNDGAAGQPFCRNGSWVPDQYNGATLDMIVADSCQDTNAWCRDDPYHVDLAQAAVEGHFMLNGQPVTTMYPNSWNNRHVTWQFEPAPSYTGDIKIGLIQSAQLTWTPIAITHLQNGIHGVDYFQNGAWVAAQMDADMGQTYIVLPTASGASTYQIRVYDSNNLLINNGRIYNFSFPSACGSSCSGPYTAVTYTTQ